MEGPFFNVKKKGAQAAEYLRMPDFGLFGRLQAAAEGLIRIACVAP
jgi:N-acetylglucosamine-6-phosphate deacetylase